MQEQLRPQDGGHPPHQDRGWDGRAEKRRARRRLRWQIWLRCLGRAATCSSCPLVCVRADRDPMRSVVLTSTWHGPVLRDTSLLTWCLAMGRETEMGEKKIISLCQWGNPQAARTLLPTVVVPTVCVLASCYGSSNAVHQDHTANYPHRQKSSFITLYFDSTSGDVTSGDVIGFDSLSLSLNIYSKVRCFAQFRLATANPVQHHVQRWLRRSGATLRLCGVFYSVVCAAGRSGRLRPGSRLLPGQTVPHIQPRRSTCVLAILHVNTYGPLPFIRVHCAHVFI